MDFLKKSLVLGLRFLRGGEEDRSEEEEVAYYDSVAPDLHPFFRDQLKDTLFGGDKACTEEELLSAACRRMMKSRPLRETDEGGTGTTVERNMRKTSESG